LRDEVPVAWAPAADRFEACTPRTRPPTTCWTSDPGVPGMDLGTGRGSAAQPPADRAGGV